MIYGFAVTFSDETTSPFPIEASCPGEAWKKLAIEIANNYSDGFFEDARVEDIELQHVGPSKERAAP